MTTDKRPSRKETDPVPAVPPLAAIMVDRLRTALGRLDGAFLYRNEALEALAFVLTGLPPGRQREVAFEQALAALEAVARPNPEAVLAATRGAA